MPERKQIIDFDLNINPVDGDNFLLQTISGNVTQRTTKAALLNQVETNVTALQTQITNNELDITILQTQVDSISAGNLDDASLSLIADLTGNLQSQIDDVVNTTNELVSITGDFAYLPGRVGGQILNGGTNPGDDLTLDSTAHSTKGDIILNSKTIAQNDLAIIEDKHFYLDENHKVFFRYSSSSGEAEFYVGGELVFSCCS